MASEQFTLFPADRCGWCGGPLNNGAPEATFCATCREDAKRMQDAKLPKVRAHIEYEDDVGQFAPERKD